MYAGLQSNRYRCFGDYAKIEHAKSLEAFVMSCSRCQKLSGRSWVRMGLTAGSHTRLRTHRRAVLASLLSLGFDCITFQYVTPAKFSPSATEIQVAKLIGARMDSYAAISGFRRCKLAGGALPPG